MQNFNDAPHNALSPSRHLSESLKFLQILLWHRPDEGMLEEMQPNLIVLLLLLAAFLALLSFLLLLPLRLYVFVYVVRIIFFVIVLLYFTSSHIVFSSPTPPLTGPDTTEIAT